MVLELQKQPNGCFVAEEEEEPEISPMTRRASQRKSSDSRYHVSTTKAPFSA